MGFLFLFFWSKSYPWYRKVFVLFCFVKYHSYLHLPPSFPSSPFMIFLVLLSYSVTYPFLFFNHFNLTFPPHHSRYFTEASSCLVHHGYSCDYPGGGRHCHWKVVLQGCAVVPSLSICHNYAAHVPLSPPFSIFRKIVHFQPCFWPEYQL